MKLSYYRQFFGARASTILRLRKLYGKNYFEDRILRHKRKQMYLQEFTRLQKYFDLSRGGKVLDIGCGTGDFLSLFGSNWEKFGIDISDWAIQIANRKGIITNFELKDALFDLIVFRGTIQHIPDPISRIGETYYWLKVNGGLVFLATPNTNSIYYRLFNSLPFISEPYNFLLPSDLMLKQILINFGFRIMGFEYPYRDTPYARPIRDFCAFILKFLKIKPNIKFPFYGNLMECYAVKRDWK